MVEVIYLKPGHEMPELHDDEPWLTVEASGDGRFFGTGFARTQSGEAVFYASPAESDASMPKALAAAEVWATKYGVRRIWVQAAPG
jgi:hypothetical protein